jgi:hypothetical protein
MPFLCTLFWFILGGDKDDANEVGDNNDGRNKSTEDNGGEELGGGERS